MSKNGCRPSSGGWVHLDMPAIALEDEVTDLGHGKTYQRRAGDVLHPDRENLAALDKIKKEIGSLLFSAQYQQRPVLVEGNLIRRSWLQYHEPAELPAPDYPSKIFQSWDAAMMTGDKNDYSVCTTWRADKDDVYLLDVYHGRLEYPDLRRKAISLAEVHGPATILMEDAGPGMNLLQDLRRSMPAGLIRPIGVKPEGSKLERMAAQSAKIEAGQVRLPKSAPWLGDFLTELLAFPNGPATIRSTASRSPCAGSKTIGAGITFRWFRPSSSRGRESCRLSRAVVT
jgi:predicted phage terminase large subunit-like protein